MMPGAPPVKLVSVTDIRGQAVLLERDRAAGGHQPQLRPGRQRAAVVRAAQLGPGAVAPLEQHQLRAAEVPVVQPGVGILAAALHPHRGRDPLAPRQRRRGHLDLRELVAGIRLARPHVTGGHAGRADHLLRGDRHRAVRDGRPVRAESAIGPVEVIRGGRARVSRAGDRHVGDVGRADGAGPAGDRAGLPGRVGHHRHAVGRAAGQRGREGERPVRGHAEVVAAVVLQHHRPGQPGHRPADR